MVLTQERRRSTSGAVFESWPWDVTTRLGFVRFPARPRPRPRPSGVTMLWRDR